MYYFIIIVITLSQCVLSGCDSNSTQTDNKLLEELINKKNEQQLLKIKEMLKKQPSGASELDIEALQKLFDKNYERLQEQIKNQPQGLTYRQLKSALDALPQKIPRPTSSVTTKEFSEAIEKLQKEIQNKPQGKRISEEQLRTLMDALLAKLPQPKDVISMGTLASELQRLKDEITKQIQAQFQQNPQEMSETQLQELVERLRQAFPQLETRITAEQLSESVEDLRGEIQKQLNEKFYGSQSNVMFLDEKIDLLEELFYQKLQSYMTHEQFADWLKDSRQSIHALLADDDTHNDDTSDAQDDDMQNREITNRGLNVNGSGRKPQWDLSEKTKHLHIAIQAGNLQKVEELLEETSDSLKRALVNGYHAQKTALHLAIAGNQETIFQLLLPYAQFDLKDEAGRCVLNCAKYYQRTMMAEAISQKTENNYV